MIASWIFGLASAWAIDSWTDVWFLAKLALVAGLTFNHIIMGQWRREFAEDQNKRSERFYRVANEVPTFFMIVIVILVIVKPF